MFRVRYVPYMFYILWCKLPNFRSYFTDILYYPRGPIKLTMYIYIKMFIHILVKLTIRKNAKFERSIIPERNF